jgi:hypothetical protein
LVSAHCLADTLGLSFHFYLKQAIIEVAALILLIGTPVATSVYLYIGLRRSRVTGRTIHGRGRCISTWEESTFHSGSLPIARSPLGWSRIPLPQGYVAVVSVKPFQPPPGSDLNDLAPDAAMPSASEVYMEMFGHAAGDEQETANGINIAAPDLKLDPRFCEFDLAYNRLMMRLFRPNTSRELLDTIVRHGPEAAFRAFNSRLDNLREKLLAERLEAAEEGQLKSQYVPLSMQAYRDHLDALLVAYDDGTFDPALERSSRFTWPMRANRIEPTCESLEAEMKRVLRIVDQERFAFTKAGFGVNLCMHMRRDGHGRSSAAARTFQKWWLSFIDLELGRTPNISLAPPRISPNVWLGTHGATGLRMDEPLFTGPSAGTTQAVSLKVRAGTAIIYDRFGSVLCFPFGICCTPLPLVVSSEVHHKHHRGVGAPRKLAGRDSTREKLQAGVVYNLARSPASVQHVRRKLFHRDQYGQLRDPSLLDQYVGLVHELCEPQDDLEQEDPDVHVELVLDGEVHLPCAAASFPRFLTDTAGVPRLSVHLCLSDCLHQKMDEEIDEPGPVRDRHTICWLTVVDLEMRRPLGRYNLPINAPYAVETYSVPAELALHRINWTFLPPPRPAPPPPRARARSSPPLFEMVTETAIGLAEKQAVPAPDAPHCERRHSIMTARLPPPSHFSSVPPPEVEPSVLEAHAAEPLSVEGPPAAAESDEAGATVAAGVEPPSVEESAVEPHERMRSKWRADASVGRFTLESEAEQAKRRPASSSLVSQSKHMARSVRNFKLVGRQRSFWQDSFTDEPSTREGPGRRAERGSKLPQSKAGSPASGGSSGGSKSPIRSKLDKSAILQSIKKRRGTNPTSESCATSVSDDPTAVIPSITGPPASDQLSGKQSEPASPLAEPPSTEPSGATGSKWSAATGVARFALFSQSKQTARSLRNLKLVGRQRSFWQDSFANEPTNTREGPGRRAERKDTSHLKSPTTQQQGQITNGAGSSEVQHEDREAEVVDGAGPKDVEEPPPPTSTDSLAGESSTLSPEGFGKARSVHFGFSNVAAGDDVYATHLSSKEPMAATVHNKKGTSAQDMKSSSPGQLSSRGKDGKKQVFKSMKNVFGRQRSFWLDGGSSSSTTDRPERTRRGSMTPQTRPTESDDVNATTLDESLSQSVHIRESTACETVETNVSEPTPRPAVEPVVLDVGMGSGSEPTPRLAAPAPASAPAPAPAPIASATAAAGDEEFQANIGEPMPQPATESAGVVDAEARLGAAVLEYELAEQYSRRHAANLDSFQQTISPPGPAPREEPSTSPTNAEMQLSDIGREPDLQSGGPPSCHRPTSDNVSYYV